MLLKKMEFPKVKSQLSIKTNKELFILLKDCEIKSKNAELRFIQNDINTKKNFHLGFS